MVKEITRYPTTPSLEFGGNVRHFNEELFAILQDLRDTIEANNLEALAAFQIGSPLSVIVVKQKDGSFLELINPRMIKHEGTLEATETTAYFPGISAKTKRYAKIKIMYEDREGKQQFLDAEGDFAVLLQRKMDYVFGGNFRMRMSEEERKRFDQKLEFGVDSIMDNGCPTVFKRDIILKVFRVFFIAGLLGVAAALFVDDTTLAMLKGVENYIMSGMLVLLVVYFFYAQYEGKQYKNCSSCQIGNIIGTTAIEGVKLLALYLASMFVF